MKEDIRLHLTRRVSLGHSMPRLAGVVAFLILFFVGIDARARDGSGTWVITNNATPNQVSGTFTTPSGDTGTFTLARSSANGYAGNATFVASTTGIYALNAINDTSPKDSFQYTLTLTANNPDVRLVAEVVQGAFTGSDTGKNSEPAKYTISSSNAITAMLASNTPVAFHTTNGAPSGGGGLPTSEQIRVWSSTQTSLTYNSYNLANYPVFPASAQLLPVDYQTFGVANRGSDYRFDVSGASSNTISLTLTMSANMSGNSHPSSTIKDNFGETFNETVGFGVRTAASLTFVKQFSSRVNASDDFTAQVVSAPTPLVSAATGTNNSATISTFGILPDVAHSLTEVVTTGAPSTTNLANYTKSISCSNAGGIPPTLPSGVSATPSWTLTANAGNVVICTLTNSANADIYITKSNAVTLVSSGATTIYTITVGNKGPAAANNALIRDAAVSGLTASGCQVVASSCTVTSGSAQCPGAASLTMADLMGGGVRIPTFPANSSISFQMSCPVQ